MIRALGMFTSGSVAVGKNDPTNTKSEVTGLLNIDFR